MIPQFFSGDIQDRELHNLLKRFNLVLDEFIIEINLIESKRFGYLEEIDYFILNKNVLKFNINHTKEITKTVLHIIQKKKIPKHIVGLLNIISCKLLKILHYFQNINNYIFTDTNVFKNRSFSLNTILETKDRLIHDQDEVFHVFKCTKQLVDLNMKN